MSRDLPKTRGDLSRPCSDSPQHAYFMPDVPYIAFALHLSQAPQNLRMTQPCAKPKNRQDDSRLNKRMVVLYVRCHSSTHISGHHQHTDRPSERNKIEKSTGELQNSDQH